jgi:hypothetical protein
VAVTLSPSPPAVTAGRPPHPRGTPLSRSTWLRVRRSLTAGLFVVATAAGVSVGLGGAALSPVAPAAPVVAQAAPMPDALPSTPHAHGHHR